MILNVHILCKHQWSGSEAGGPDAVHQQKLKVLYLPAEGQTLVEEDENTANQSSILAGGDSVRPFLLKCSAQHNWCSLAI